MKFKKKKRESEQKTTFGLYSAEKKKIKEKIEE